MKSLLILFLLILYPLMSFAEIDERKTDVYFANGISTDEGNATANTRLLRNSILETQYYGIEIGMKKHIGKVTEAYNSTYGFLPDGIETFLQKFGWIALNIVFKALHDPDLSQQITAYKESIKSGHKVLVVAHSQGNLFTREAYLAIDTWMQDYFLAVTIASPMSEDVKYGTTRIDWDNDIVPRIASFGNSLPWMIENDVRNVNWVTNNPLGVGQPTSDYVNKVDIGRTFVSTYSYRAEEAGVDSNVHAFTFYMGENLRDGDREPINPFTDTKLKDLSAKTKIMTAIDTQIKLLEQVPSQWQVKAKTGCGCEQQNVLTHTKSPETMDNLVSDISALSFDTNGKLYQVYDETNTTLHWVKGNPNGTAVKNEQDHLPNVCYSLTGTDEIIKGSSNPDPTDGVLRVVLDWDKKDIDLDLSIDGPTAGVKEEHPEYECPRENWYVANESGLAKGDYIVSVTAPSSVDQALMPEKVRIDVKAIGKGEYIGIDINDSALLNLGEVYKIHVEVPASGATSGISRVTTAPIASTVSYHEDSDGTIYTADIFLLLKQVAMGPIAGASLLLRKFNNGEWQSLYTGVTTSGATINSNGLIIFPASLQESVLASDILLLSASGGHDVDADDDLNMDETPTVVLGKLHAFIDAENIAGNNFKVNILTEIAYQAIRNRLDENTTKEALFAMLDGVSKLLIKNDLNDDNAITYKDTTTWLASFDKEKLQFDYNEKIEPIVQKIYSGEEIYLDVYKLLYAGKIDGLQVDNNSTENTLRLELNSYTDLSQLQKEDFVLNDSSGNSVDFTFAIVDGKVVIDPLNDLVEGERYTLSFDLKISDDQDNVFVDTQLHTFIVPDITPPVIPESTIHINENYGSELPFNASDPSTPLTYSIVGGTDSALFEIKNVFVGYGMYADRIYFKEMPNYERPSDSNGDNIYELDISVADSFENVTTQSIRIVVDDVKEGPLLADTNMTVNENMPIGTYVGTMTVLNEGDGNLTDFYLSDENFRIDREGKIYTKIIFDYERISEFKLGIRAKNSVGAWAITKNAFVTITDVPEPLPEVHAFTGSMDDHAPQGKVVGQLYVYPGLDATAEVRLTGEGAEDFDVNSTGHVTVSATADLDHKIRRQYDLKAIASNSYGESNEANVTIYVNVWTKQIGTEFRDYTRATTVDNDNNFYLTGVKNYNSPEQGTTFISKYNSTGQLMWSYENNQSEKIRFWSITVDQNGTVFVTGAKATGRTYVSYNYTYESYASWILALSSQGKVLWTRVLDNGATGSDYLETAFIDPQGDVIASGRTYGAFPGYEKNGVNVFFTKFSKLGDKEWIKQFNMPSYNTQVTPLGEFYFESGNRIIKFDSNLESITWEKEFIISDIANTYYDGVNFTLDNDGNILFLCRQYTWVEWNINSNYFYEDDYDSVIVKFNQDGEFLWLKNYGSDKYEYPSVIKVNNKNEIYFAGDTRGNYYNNINKAPYLDPEEVGDVFLTKLDADGNMLDSKQFGSIGWDGMNTIAIDNNNDVYMTGGVNDSLDGNVHLGGYDMFIMKVPY